MTEEMNLDKDIANREKLKTDLEGLTTFEEGKDEPEESDKDKVLQILLDPEGINLKTELNDKEILEISRLHVVAERIGSKSLDSFLKNFKELRVSKGRQGRKEIIGAMQEDDVKKSEGFFNQFVTDLVGSKKP